MKLVAALFLTLLVLHQDTWNWDDGSLLFGFLPVGLAYHAAFSILSAALAAFAIRRLWPEDDAEETH